jgi:hypothetical protein
MNRHIKKLFVSLLVIALTFSGLDIPLHYFNISTIADAHSGRTDSSGGHKDNKNKSGLGYYHYHCGGNPPHLHKDGVCPYDKTVSLNSDTDSIKITKSIIKKVQKELNDLGYECGKADGKAGSKTKKALKEYQDDYGLKVDGTIGKEVLDSMGIYY